MKIFKLIIPLIGLILFNNQVLPQGKFEISGGFGIPEIVNVKIRYGKNFQIALSQGFIPTSPIELITAAEIYYHCVGKSKIIEQRPWYLFGALGTMPAYFDQIFFSTRFGRSINLSNKMGLNIDFGLFLFKDLQVNVYPSGGINIFIRL